MADTYFYQASVNNPNPQDVNQTSSDPSESPRPMSPNPITRFAPIAIVIGLLVIVVSLVVDRLPSNFETCATWPASRVSDQYPATCTTFYGATFDQTIADFDIELPRSNDQTNQDQTTDTSFTFPNQAPTLTATDQAEATKGSQPVPTQAPTPAKAEPTQKPAPTNPAASPDSSITLHRYPEQRFTIAIPSNYNATDVTRRIDTGVETFNIYSHSTLLMAARISSSWPEGIKDKPVSFQIDQATTVIAVETDSSISFTFQKTDRIHHYICYDGPNDQLKAGCQSMIQSIKFQ